MIRKMTPAFTLMVMLVALLMVVLLTGCSTESAEKETTPAKQKEVTKTEEKAEEPTKKEATKDDGYEYGDKTQHVAKEFNQEIKIGDIQLDIRSAELITVENLTEEASINFEMYGYEEGKPFNLMEIKYDVTNTSDKNISFTFPIYTVVLSNGEQIDATMQNMNPLESGTGDFYANSNQKDLSIVVPFKSDPKEVKGFRIITDSVNDLEYNTLAEPVEAEFKF